LVPTSRCSRVRRRAPRRTGFSIHWVRAKEGLLLVREFRFRLCSLP
jgi:hypothetical protein